MRTQRQETVDAERVEALYRQYGPLIYGRCRKLLKDDEAAQDATQEVFLRVIRHLDKVPVTGSVAAWLSRISINYCLNLIRDEQRTDHGAEVPEPSGAPHPEHVLAQRDLAQKLLDKAPAPLRDSVLLHHMQGLKQGQVARQLGVSRRTIIYRLERFAELAARFQARVGREAA